MTNAGAATYVREEHTGPAFGPLIGRQGKVVQQTSYQVQVIYAEAI